MYCTKLKLALQLQWCLPGVIWLLDRLPSYINHLNIILRRLYTLNEYYNFQVANFTGENALFTLPASIPCASTELDRLDAILMRTLQAASLSAEEFPLKLRQAKVELLSQYLEANHVRFPEVLMAMLWSLWCSRFYCKSITWITFSTLLHQISGSESAQAGCHRDCNHWQAVLNWTWS